MTDEIAPVGRPLFRPTPRQRKLVIKRVASNWTQDLIAKELVITPPTLRLHFEEELRDGKSLYRKGLIDLLEKEAGKGSVSAIKTLLALTVDPTPSITEPSMVATKLGKKETQKLHAKKANSGKFSTPPPPGTSAKTVQ